MLSIVQEEVSNRFSALPLPRQRTADEVPLRQLFNANLPATELSVCKEILRKLTAIDSASVAAESVRRQLRRPRALGAAGVARIQPVAAACPVGPSTQPALPHLVSLPDCRSTSS